MESMKTLTAFAVIAVMLLSVCAASAAEYETVAVNFSADIAGQVDTRGACCWGTEGEARWSVNLVPDAQVIDGVIQIEEIHGDLTAWPTLMGTAPAIMPNGRFIGVLVALHRQDRWDSHLYCNWCNRDALLYMQGAISAQQPVTRIPFDIVDMGYRLGPDNVLIVKVAQWLNDTGLMAHMEPTLTIKYRTVKADEHPIGERASCSISRDNAGGSSR